MFDDFLIELHVFQWRGHILAVLIGLLFAVCVFIGMLALVKRRVADRPSNPKSPILPPPPPPRNERFVDPFQAGTFGERRNALRRGENPVAVYVSNETATSPPFCGWVLDRSMGGLCIAVETAIPEGRIISVRATNAPETAPWIQVEVRRCKQEGDQWELGCHFLKTPSWGVLLLFG